MLPSATSSKAKKRRLDQLLVLRGLVPSRERAMRLILSGSVLVDGERRSKPGQLVSADSAVALLNRPPYVSRGGEKLIHALKSFRITVNDRACLDIGASTGGFTHCLLLQGASRMYAVDVGKGQLDQRLRNDPRVVVMDETNARFLVPEDFAPRPTLATVDVSFISLEKVLGAVAACLDEPGEVIALVKPQFEVGRGQVGKGGVIRDPIKHRRVLSRVVEFAIGSGLSVLGLTASPLRGPKGNREFFVHLSRRGESVQGLEEQISDVVNAG
ncbi:MAG TPA: TlyA family RNA methyltransferase [Methylomirabilota bacterium]|nr:TlyA family RNA methyltransferase [Methylomirabilota bacterium]